MSFDNAYGECGNWATWDAKLMFLDLYNDDNETSRDIVDDIIKSIEKRIDPNEKFENIYNVLSQCITDEISNFENYLENEYEELLEAQFDSMTPKEIFNYGKSVGREDVDFKKLAEIFVKDFPVYLASYVDNKQNLHIEFGSSSEDSSDKIDENALPNNIFIMKVTFDDFLDEKKFNNIISELKKEYGLQDQETTKNTSSTSKKQKNVVDSPWPKKLETYTIV